MRYDANRSWEVGNAITVTIRSTSNNDLASSSARMLALAENHPHSFGRLLSSILEKDSIKESQPTVSAWYLHLTGAMEQKILLIITDQMISNDNQ